MGLIILDEMLRDVGKHGLAAGLYQSYVLGVKVELHSN